MSASLPRSSDLRRATNPGAAHESGALKQAGDEWRGGATLPQAGHGHTPIAGSSRRHKGEADRAYAGNEAPPREPSPAGSISTVASGLSSRRAVTALLAGLVLAGGAIFSARAEQGVMRDIAANDLVASPRSDLISIARRDIGKSGPQLGLPARLWCGWAMNRWRRAAGLSIPRSGLAADHASHGRKVSRPVVGALLIERRRGGAHVSVITAVHVDGTVTAISGNDGKRVRERFRSARGIVVIPT